MNKYEELVYSLIYNCNRELTVEEKETLNQASAIYNNYNQLTEQLGCPLEVREKALNGFYIPDYGYVSNDDDFIYLRKDDNGYYLKVVIHPSKPIPPDFYGYCDIHYLKDYKKTWWLEADKSE